MEKVNKLIESFKSRNLLEHLKVRVSKEYLPEDATHIKVDGGVIARKQKRKSKDGSPQIMMVLIRGKWVTGNIFQSELDRGDYVLLDDVRKQLIDA